MSSTSYLLRSTVTSANKVEGLGESSFTPEIIAGSSSTAAVILIGASSTAALTVIVFNKKV